jgi:hypothetical protein
LHFFVSFIVIPFIFKEETTAVLLHFRMNGWIGRTFSFAKEGRFSLSFHEF